MKICGLSALLGPPQTLFPGEVVRPPGPGQEIDICVCVYVIQVQSTYHLRMPAASGLVNRIVRWRGRDLGRVEALVGSPLWEVGQPSR